MMIGKVRLPNDDMKSYLYKRLWFSGYMYHFILYRYFIIREKFKGIL